MSYSRWKLGTSTWCLFWASLFLLGCASPQPTEAQRAVVSYYKQKCIAQGVSETDIDALAACVMINYRKDAAAVSRDCVTYPVLGGTQTTCR